jgi:hypothetical protein
MNSYYVGSGGTDKVTFPDGHAETFNSASRLDCEAELVVERIDEASAALPGKGEAHGLGEAEALSSQVASLSINELLKEVVALLQGGDAKLGNLSDAAKAALDQM